MSALHPPSSSSDSFFAFYCPVYEFLASEANCISMYAIVHCIHVCIHLVHLQTKRSREQAALKNAQILCEVSPFTVLRVFPAHKHSMCTHAYAVRM